MHVMLTRSVAAAQRSAAAGALLACAPLLAQAQKLPIHDGRDRAANEHPRVVDAHRRHPGDGARRHGDGNRVSWGWCIGAILGIAIAFGAPQIVIWVRGMFGV